jgi:hypothetical protein
MSTTVSPIPLDTSRPFSLGTLSHLRHRAHLPLSGYNDEWLLRAATAPFERPQSIEPSR